MGMIITNIQERDIGWVLTYKGTKKKGLLKRREASPKDWIDQYYLSLQKAHKEIAKQKKICQEITNER